VKYVRADDRQFRPCRDGVQELEAPKVDRHSLSAQKPRAGSSDEAIMGGIGTRHRTIGQLRDTQKTTGGRLLAPS